MFKRISRNLREGTKNISRNKLFTFASVATMSLCIFLVGLFFAIGFNIMTILKDVETNVPITVFFEKNIDITKQREIVKKVENEERVKSVKFVTADEAWKRYKEIYFKDKPELAEAFKEQNPLKHSASLEIYLKDIENQGSFAKQLKTIPGVRQVNHSSDVANKLSSFNYTFLYVSAAIIVLLLFIAIFLISNTVSLGIAVRKDEIHIMQYVGAKDKFIRGPFVTEGVLIGMMGVIIPLIIEYLLYSKLIEYVYQKVDVLKGTQSFVGVTTIFMYFVPIAILIGLCLGYFASRITISRYLNR